MMDIQPLYEEFSMSKYVSISHRDANVLMVIAGLREEIESLRTQLAEVKEDNLDLRTQVNYRCADVQRLQAEKAELVEAIRNLKQVKGRHNTQIACDRLFALLPKE